MERSVSAKQQLRQIFRGHICPENDKIGRFWKALGKGRAMREKTLKPVVTFATTSDAMAMEALAREHGIPGRIVPVPSEIDAGCGLAWCADAGEKEALIRGLDEHGITHEGLFEVMLY